MIHIDTCRVGLFVIAATVNDDLEITATIALTTRAAERRLMRVLDRKWSR